MDYKPERTPEYLDWVILKLYKNLVKYEPEWIKKNKIDVDTYK